MWGVQLLIGQTRNRIVNSLKPAAWLAAPCKLDAYTILYAATPGFVAAQARSSLPPAALADAASQLTSLLPGLDKSPMTAGAAALALGYIGATGQLPDLPPPVTAGDAAGDAGDAGKGADANGGGEGGGDTAAAAAGAAQPLLRAAALLPSTAVIGAREVTAAAAGALCRIAAGVGLGAAGEGRPEVLRGLVKGEAALLFIPAFYYYTC